ncbi:E2/UBC family protein [Lentzea sp. NPDC005914]|uniref:E2/UBC family protein n=1 Tax=Lentzea sp. NPDC005914 TaxID=3154572 RepID=UPI0033E80CBD
MLPTVDTKFLEERGLRHSVQVDGGMICVLLPDWKVPAGYQQDQTDLLLRLSQGYPDVPPDMWWCSPALVLTNGSQPQATEVTEHHLGRSWQRWSRHFNNPGIWRPGIDSLESYLARIRGEMLRSAGRAA